MGKPKISIITICYNSEKTIAHTLQSVAEQNYENLEYVIVDGASKDNTLKVAEHFKNKISRLISEPDQGIYDAMNKGLNLVTGDIIGILNSDDFYVDNNVISKIAKRFDDPAVDCVHADLYYVNKDNTAQIVRHWKSCAYSPGAFRKGWHPAHPTFFVRKRVYEKYGLFDLNFNLAADFELMLRFLERYKINSIHLPEPVVRMRLGGATSKNIKNIIEQNIECYKAFKVNGIKVSYLYAFLRAKI